MNSTLIAQIQSTLRSEGIDGWLLYNFRGSNVFATRLLALPPHIMCTRRYFSGIGCVPSTTGTRYRSAMNDWKYSR